MAPINYVIGPGRGLTFYSAIGSRHSLALEQSSRIAVAVFNSEARSADVDGLQIDGSCEIVGSDELAHAHAHYFTVNFPDPQEREWWLRPTEAFEGSGLWRFYRVTIHEAFVIDYESIEQERVDRRLSADVDGLWNQLERVSTG